VFTNLGVSSLLALGGVGVGVGGAYYGLQRANYLPDFMQEWGADEAAPQKAAPAKAARETPWQLREAVDELTRSKRGEVATDEAVDGTAGETPVLEIKGGGEEEKTGLGWETTQEEEGDVSLEHPENGNRVSLDKISAFYQAVHAGRAAQEAREAAAPQTNEYVEPVTDPMAAVATAAAAMAELRSAPDCGHSNAAADLAAAHLADLDVLPPPLLRDRLVRLVEREADRARQEALRLRELLAMKEAEVGDRYLAVLQKQRLEFEALLAQRLREQEDSITRQANAALQAKDEGLAALLKESSAAREAEARDALAEDTRRVAAELELEHRTRRANELGELKTAHATALEGHAAAATALRDRLAWLESRLEVSNTYKSGSRRAHRVSAAALALAGRLEASGGAFAVELAALRGAVTGEEGGVIANAVRMIPERRATTGVPTVAELQRQFDKAYVAGRQAAMVPEGRASLEGQVLGMLFAKLSVPPPPAAVPASNEEGNVVDGILSLARKHVEAGDLESAVKQLDLLQGQTAHVVHNWKTKATDRVSTERALRVIKLECALLNKDLVGA